MFVISVWYKGFERNLLASLIEFDSKTMIAKVCDEALCFPLSDVIDITPVTECCDAGYDDTARFMPSLMTH